MQQPTPTRFTQAARKHRIGRAHVFAALADAGEPEVMPAPDADRDDRLRFVGTDDRGVELEIIAVQTPECLLVIHVMPTSYLKGNR